jgi:LmbE family N-acetylglucosaminyl deacetylase
VVLFDQRVGEKKFLFIFAHPDYDTFICGTMKAAMDAGADITAAWATSGDYFGKGRERENELHHAMDLLGLPEPSRVLLRLPDLGLVRLLPEAALRTTELMSSVRPDVVFANAFEGGHPDHDCVNFLAYEAASRAGIQPLIYEFPLYNGAGHFYHWRWRINGFPNAEAPVEAVPLRDDIIRIKHKMMMAAYSSQWMYMYPARAASGVKKLRTQGEPFRVCAPERDHTRKPHTGSLNYERWFNSFMKIRFGDFRRAVEITRSSESHDRVEKKAWAPA